MKMKLTKITVAAACVSALASLPAAAVTKAEKEFLTECSACHIPYPPNFLPARSWNRIMDTLSNHFGEDASLDKKTAADIRAVLLKYSYKGRIRGVGPNDVPVRITSLPWFKAVHGNRVRNYVLSHPEIGSVSNCAGCHRGAANGRFEDD